MKTRRIHLQPDEVVEVCNYLGHSVLKATVGFLDDKPCITLYEQPGTAVLTPAEHKDLAPAPHYSFGLDENLQETN